MWSYHVSKLDAFFYAHKDCERKILVSPYLKQYKKGVNDLSTNHLRQTSSDFKKDLSYLTKVEQQILPVIIKRLKVHHNNEYSTFIYDKSIRIFLRRYLTNVYDEYCLHKKSFKTSYHYKVLSPSCYKTLNTFQEVRELTQQSEFGFEQLFSQYVSYFHSDQFNKNTVNASQYPEKNFVPKLKSQSKKSFFFQINNLKSLIIRILLKLCSIRSPQVLIYQSFFSRENLNKLILKSLGRINQCKQIPKANSEEFDLQARDMIFARVKNFDEFSNFALFTLKYNFPKLLIENFYSQIEYFKKFATKYKDLKYIISESWISNDHSAFFLAYMREVYNVKHIHNEHNCLFHMLEGSNTNDEIELCDTFLTLGWDSSNPKAITGASLFPYTIKSNNKKNIEILYISGFAFIKRAQLCSQYCTSQEDAEKFLKQNKDFLSGLEPEVISKIVYRDYPPRPQWLSYDKGIYLNSYLNKFHAIDDFKKTSKEQMESSKLIILDYISTAHLESLSMNIPTIILYDKDRYILNEEYKDFFDELIKAKIVHQTPSSAADFINSNHKNIDHWWNSKIVQTARQRFLDKNLGNPESAINFYLSLVYS